MIFTDYAKYAKKRSTANFESRFINLDKCNKIFEIYSSSTFRVDVESAIEYLQIEPIDLQCNNELKDIIKITESKINFYNIYITKTNF